MVNLVELLTDELVDEIIREAFDRDGQRFHQRGRAAPRGEFG